MKLLIFLNVFENFKTTIELQNEARLEICLYQIFYILNR